MAEESKDIIKQFGNNLLKDMKAAVPSATGKTRDSLNIEFTKTGFIIRGGAQIGAIIDGRKPTKQGAKKGNPTLRDEILEWIKAKSIQPRESSMSQETLAFLISRSIHKNGYPGKGNIFKSVITASRIASLTETLITNEALAIQSNLIKEFNFK
jgi:hypothetical protein